MPLHPAVVHLPVALLAFALAVDLAALACRRSDWHGFAYATQVTGVFGGAAAVLSGNRAAAAFRDHAAAAAIQRHEDLATLAFLLALGAVVGRLSWYLRQRRAAAAGPAAAPRAPWPWIALAAGAVVLLAAASHRGGQLVFELGVGVTAPSAESLPVSGVPTVPEGTGAPPHRVRP